MLFKKQSIEGDLKQSRPKNHRKHKEKTKSAVERKKMKDHWLFAWRLTKMTLQYRLSPELYL